MSPILSALPPASSLARPDGPREGNADVRRSVAAGERQHSAWAHERANGGRGVGWAGGHFYSNWQVDAYQRLALNAVLWTARVAVPPGGVRLDGAIAARRTPSAARLGAKRPRRLVH